MRKILCTMVLLLAVALTGCTQEKTQVETYLGELKAVNESVKKQAQEMQQTMMGMQREMSSGKFDAEKIKGHILEYQDKMKADKARLEAMSVPEKARALHDATVKQYDVTITVIGKIPNMVEIGAKMREVGARGKADGAQRKAAMEELGKLNEQLGASQKELKELTSQAKELEKTARAEKKKLQEAFQLTPDESPTPADGRPEGRPMPGRFPAGPGANGAAPVPGATPPIGAAGMTGASTGQPATPAVTATSTPAKGAAPATPAAGATP